MPSLPISTRHVAWRRLLFDGDGAAGLSSAWCTPGICAVVLLPLLLLLPLPLLLLTLVLLMLPLVMLLAAGCCCDCCCGSCCGCCASLTSSSFAPGHQLLPACSIQQCVHTHIYSSCSATHRKLMILLCSLFVLPLYRVVLTFYTSSFTSAMLSRRCSNAAQNALLALPCPCCPDTSAPHTGPTPAPTLPNPPLT